MANFISKIPKVKLPEKNARHSPGPAGSAPGSGLTTTGGQTYSVKSSGANFWVLSCVVLAVAVLVQLTTMNNAWVPVFGEVAQQHWFVVMMNYLPAGVLLVGVAFSWIYSRIDDKIWTRPAAWGIGVLGYVVYMVVSQAAIPVFASTLSNIVPAEYVEIGSLLCFWAIMVLAISKAIGRFVIHIPVVVSQNIFGLGIVIMIVLVFLWGAWPQILHDLLYTFLEPSFADYIIEAVKAAPANLFIDPRTVVPHVVEAGSAQATVIAQAVAIVLKIFPQWLASVILMHAFQAKGD